MVAHVKTVTFQGVDVTEVEAQVQIAPGIPSFTIVGLPDKAVAESRERVRAAISSLGLSLPVKRIVVNLSPADLLKEGSHFDLPIAMGILIGMGVIPADSVENYFALGELSLDGRLLPIAGVLPAAIGASASGCGIICPEACGGEAVWAGDIPILAPSSLLALINHVKGTQVLSLPEATLTESARLIPDLKMVRGQESARRALEIGAAGGHNLLMTGPPGAGKSLLASCLPGLLPPLDTKEMLEVSMIASVAGILNGGRLSRVRPFREPHHSSSLAAMVGGGRRAVPGEISLAHQGVLFLDELPEFPRAVLEAMRQPMETGRVSVARVNAHVTYPADFQLIAAMNPCRCGYLDDPGRACSKAPRCAQDYQSKISGPLLDRMDICIDVPAVDTMQMFNASEGEATAPVAARVAAARNIQSARFARMGLGYRTNASIGAEELNDIALPEAEGMALLEQATQRFGMSMRGFTRILRVARTIADLEGSDSVQKRHVAEAISYRQPQWGRALETA